MRKLLLPIVFVYLPIFIFAQKSDWKASSYLGIGFSSVQGSDLNAVMSANSLPDFAWSSIFLSSFAHARRDRFVLVYSFDIAAKFKNLDIYGATTFNTDIMLGAGYSLLTKKRIDIWPYAGPKFYLKGYWMNCKGENTSFNQYFSSTINSKACYDYNFFSTQLAGVVGFQLVLKNKTRKKNVASLAADYALVSSTPNFFRANAELDERIEVVNPFSLRVGIQIGG